MASAQAIRNKSGVITSYQIKVFRGYANGKQLSPFTKTWKVPDGMSEKRIAKELERVKAEFEIECENGDISAVGNPKLADFCVTYLDIQRGTLAPRTFEYYSGLIESLIIPKLGHMKLSELKPANVQKFIREIQAIPTAKGTMPSASTIKRKVSCLQSILRQAVKLRIIKENPADAKCLTIPKVVTPNVDIFTKEGAAQMLDCLANESLEFRCLVHLAFATGARRGEIVALRFSDIDYTSGRIQIKRSAYKTKGESIGVKSPKDGEVRTVYIYPELVSMIIELQKKRQTEHERLGTAWRGDDWLFTKWDGSIMHPQTPSKQWGKFLSKYGLPHHKFHSLRHTSATLLLCAGMNVRQVQERLGHGSIRTTQIYLHSIQEADKQCADALRSVCITQSKPNAERETDALRLAK